MVASGGVLRAKMVRIRAFFVFQPSAQSTPALSFGYGHKGRLYWRFGRRGGHIFAGTSGRKTNFLVIPPVAKAHHGSVDGSKLRRNYEGF